MPFISFDYYYLSKDNRSQPCGQVLLHPRGYLDLKKLQGRCGHRPYYLMIKKALLFLSIGGTGFQPVGAG